MARPYPRKPKLARAYPRKPKLAVEDNPPTLGGEITQVEKLLKLCRDYGVSKLQTPEFVIEMGSPAAPVSPLTAAKIAEALAKGEMTPEEALFASVEQAVPREPQE